MSQVSEWRKLLQLRTIEAAKCGSAQIRDFARLIGLEIANNTETQPLVEWIAEMVVHSQESDIREMVQVTNVMFGTGKQWEHYKYDETAAGAFAVVIPLHVAFPNGSMLFREYVNEDVLSLQWYTHQERRVLYWETAKVAGDLVVNRHAKCLEHARMQNVLIGSPNWDPLRMALVGAAEYLPNENKPKWTMQYSRLVGESATKLLVMDKQTSVAAASWSGAKLRFGHGQRNPFAPNGIGLEWVIDETATFSTAKIADWADSHFAAGYKVVNAENMLWNAACAKMQTTTSKPQYKSTNATITFGGKTANTNGIEYKVLGNQFDVPSWVLTGEMPVAPKHAKQAKQAKSESKKTDDVANVKQEIQNNARKIDW